MNQKITGFEKDDEGHWRAILECGHRQHVRHDPPMTTREWVLTPEGRDSRLGFELECKRCDEESGAFPQKYESHLDRVSTGSGSDLVQSSESESLRE